MGAGSSLSLLAADAINTKTLILESKGVQTMANALFTFMFSQWDAREIWDIANKPEDYVIALSDLITNQFHVLGYRTERNKAGEIYFMKYEGSQAASADRKGLAPPGHKKGDGTEYKNSSGETQKYSSTGIEQQRQTARIIAFYFIRLFQIMGSLLLVIKDINVLSDEELAAQGKSVSRPIMNEQSPVYLSPIFKKPLSMGGQSGGRLDRSVFLGPYEFLRGYLSNLTPSRYPATIESLLNTTIEKGIPYYKVTDTLFFAYKEPEGIRTTTVNLKDAKFVGKFVVLTKQSGAALLIDIPIFITSINPPTIDYNKLYGTNNSRTPVHFTTTFKIVKNNAEVKDSIVIYNDSEKEYLFQITGLPISGMDTTDKEEFTNVLQRLIVDTYSKYNQPIVLAKIAKAPDNTERVRKPDEMPKDIKASKTVDEVYKPLLNQTFRPHCIARALQLLDRSLIDHPSIINQGNLKTNICTFKMADGPLSSYTPTKLLGQLYGKVDPKDRVRMKSVTDSSGKQTTDQIDGKDMAKSIKILEAFVGKDATPRPLSVSELSSQPNEAESLQRALVRLQEAFDKGNKGKVEVKSLDSIAMKKPGKCESNDGKLTGTTAADMQRISQQLLASHMKYTKNMVKFLQTMFNITKRSDDTWKIEGPNTEILYAGFPVLDTLTNQARELLVDYYSGCETLYQKGVTIWEKSIPDAKNAATGAVAAPSTGAVAAPGPGSNTNSRETRPGNPT
jgi:hypothetical protein